MSDTATTTMASGTSRASREGRHGQEIAVEARHRPGGVRVGVPRADRQASGRRPQRAAARRCRARRVQEHAGPDRGPHGGPRRARGDPRRPDGADVRHRRHRRRRQGAARLVQDDTHWSCKGGVLGGVAALGRRRQRPRRPAVARGAAGPDRRSLPGAAGQDRQLAAGPATQVRLRPAGPDREQAPEAA